ncbi:MAG: type II toxin-antitoxin system RelE family toxin [Acidimicrobiales bacterium]
MALSLTRRAGRDLDALDRPTRAVVLEALHRLEGGTPNLDVKPLAGHAPWQRFRVGIYRVVFHPVGDLLIVTRIVHRRDLELAVKTL